MQMKIGLRSKLSVDFFRLLSSETDELPVQSWPLPWWRNDFGTFCKSLKFKLPLNQKNELLHIYDKYRLELVDLDSEIEQLNQEIDRHIYELYDLNPKEVSIIED